MENKQLFNKYKNLMQRKHSLEVRQFKLGQHLANNPTDYVSVVANELLLSDIYRNDYKLKETLKRMELSSYAQ